MAGTGVSLQGREAAEIGACLSLAVAFRSGRMVSSTGGAAVPFPLSDRDLHAGAEAEVRLLRASLFGRRASGGTRGLKGGSGRGPAPGTGVTRRRRSGC